MERPRKKSRFSDSNDLSKTLEAINRLKDAQQKNNRRSTFQAPALILNKDGKVVDEFGKELKTSGPVSTLKVNQKRQQSWEQEKANKRAKIHNPYLAHTSGIEENDRVGVMDSNLKTHDRSNRAVSGLKFIQQGSYIKRASAIRAREARKESLQQDARRHFREIEAKKEDEGKTEISQKDVGVAALLAKPEIPPLPLEEEPRMEWWDVPFLPKSQRVSALKDGPGGDRYDLLNINNKATINGPFCELVEHPEVIQGIAPKKEVKQMQVFLTKKERKRLRRMNRAERFEEQRIKVQIGLIPPPEPKVKIANMMRVMQAEAVADPSKVEKHVNEQLQKRIRNHEMRNLAKKLTPEERRAKKEKKIAQDAQGAPHVAVFRVTNLSTPPELSAKRRFKMDVNAQTFKLTGCVLLVENKVLNHENKPTGCNVVVVEGGPKAIKKFQGLMLRRIDWKKTSLEDNSDSEDSDDEEDNTEEANSCHMVWSGQVAQRAFSTFQYEECVTGDRARQFVASKGVAHYWDLCANFNPDAE